jgi:hypothetical protein
MTETKPKGRKAWVAGKVVANLDTRRLGMFNEILEKLREQEARTTQTNVIERAIENLHADMRLTD